MACDPATRISPFGAEVWTLGAPGSVVRAERELQLGAPPGARSARVSQTSLEQQQYLGLTRSVRLAAHSVLSRVSTVRRHPRVARCRDGRRPPAGRVLAPAVTCHPGMSGAEGRRAQPSSEVPMRKRPRSGAEGEKGESSAPNGAERRGPRRGGTLGRKQHMSPHRYWPEPPRGRLAGKQPAGPLAGSFGYAVEFEQRFDKGACMSAGYVYTARDGDGRVLYVDVTSDLKARMGAHRRNSRWWSMHAHIEVEEFATMEAAERAE